MRFVRAASRVLREFYYNRRFAELTTTCGANLGSIAEQIPLKRRTPKSANRNLTFAQE